MLQSDSDPCFKHKVSACSKQLITIKCWWFWCVQSLWLEWGFFLFFSWGSHQSAATFLWANQMQAEWLCEMMHERRSQSREFDQPPSPHSLTHRKSKPIWRRSRNANDGEKSDGGWWWWGGEEGGVETTETYTLLLVVRTPVVTSGRPEDSLSGSGSKGRRWQKCTSIR